ncbi:CPBP family intramembrane metalloprotease [Clostridium sardiniense]|uniref:CPBP family intramembrane metalloprotease n=1 Tax=Clostridium sardiniense TaxID=29369 RepID=A0ABS7L225_CLOSR|nr:type II CAAX endopeptidase family protein [Clostridium sardiniense]MBY0757131.1 CPBP family intramembrane metalloprotease [Clostridium sardiniense]MDQ0461411.1 membrane protease YdiL (CAAX protease family) [Clostridium sardiniense]
MKKYLGVFGKIIGFGLIYLIMQALVGMIYGFIIMAGAIMSQSDINMMGTQIMNNQFILAVISALITFLIYVLMLRKRKKNLWERCKFNKIKKSYIPIIILATLGFAVLSSAFVALVGDKFTSYSDTSKGLMTAYNSIYTMISVTIIIPIFEEILFRGLIFDQLKRGFNVIVAIILQAIIFGLFHFNPVQTMYTIVLGIILGVIVTWSNSIIGSMIGHITYNIVGILVMPMIVYYVGDYTAIYAIIGSILLIVGVILIYKTYKVSNRKVL